MSTSSRDARVLAVIRDHAPSLLRLARRHSLCADDAQDAYQRALEIFLRRVDTVEPATAGAWLRTVVKHEAMAVRRARQQVVAGEEIDFDATFAADVPDGEERALSFDRVTRAAEALQRCKEHEVGALMLKAEGHSYHEISAITGWSYTKVNRCITEGRKRFLETYAAIEAGEECRRLAPVVSALADGEATARQLADLRPHLRNCAACRATLRALHDSRPAVQAVLPVGVLGTGAIATDGGSGLLARLSETVTATLHDAALRVHAVVETMTTGKAAAVAASAAAVAGGGAVATDQATPREPQRTALIRTMEPTRAKPPVRAPSPPVRSRTPARTEATPTPARPAAHQRAAVSAPEFGFEGPVTARPTSPAHPVGASRPVRTTSPQNADDFGFER
jgi:RNA polymerase sigma factor (sigma-70 family)